MSFQDLGWRASLGRTPQPDTREYAGRKSIEVYQSEETFGDTQKRAHSAPYMVGLSSSCQSPKRSLDIHQSSTERNASTSATFSLLSDDILQFQRIVWRMNSVLHNDSVDQHFHLVTSAENLCSRIEEQLAKEDNRTAPSSRTADLKLTKDFHRAQASFVLIRPEFRRRQKAESRQIDIDGRDGLNSHQRTIEKEQMLAMQREEEFNMKVMQDREADVLEINRKMHQVNEIYKDLGEIVQGQQEQVDTAENLLWNANDNAKGGLEHIEKANRRKSDGNTLLFQDVSTKPEKKRSSFGSFREDMNGVKNGLAGFGSGLVGSSFATLQAAKGVMLSCASLGDVSESPLL